MVRGLTAAFVGLTFCLPALAADPQTTGDQAPAQPDGFWAEVFPLPSDSFGGHTLEMMGDPHDAQTRRQQQAEVEGMPEPPDESQGVAQNLPLPADAYGGWTVDMFGNPHDQPTIVQAHREADAEAAQMAETPEGRRPAAPPR